MSGVTQALAAAVGAPVVLAAAGSTWAAHQIEESDAWPELTISHQAQTLGAAQRASSPELIRVANRSQVRARLGYTLQAAQSPGLRTVRYRIRSGDTITGLAARWRVSPQTLLRLNHLDRRGRIYAGQYLHAPVTPVKAQRKIARPTSTYRVRRGDTVTAIAARQHTSVAAVLKLNGLGPWTLIYPGQTLRLPRPIGHTRPTARTQSSARPAARNNTFAGRTYPDDLVSSAEANRTRLADLAVPGPDATRRLVARTASQYGVDPALAMAVAFQESGFNQRRVSVANAIGTMQVIPSSGRWASDLVGRRLDLLHVQDNITAGVVILKSLLGSAPTRAHAIAGYYQGLGSVRRNGMYADTRRYVANVEHLSRRFD